MYSGEQVRHTAETCYLSLQLTLDNLNTMQTLELLFILVRFVLIFTTGYIHPDEFFQSPSPTASYIIPHGRNATEDPLLITWEFTHPAPQRSMLIPLVTVGPTLYLLRFLNIIHAHALLYAPRIGLFLLSLFIDGMANKILNNVAGRIVFKALWPVIVFHTRPFSNTTEAFTLVLCMYVAVYLVPKIGPKWYLYIALGTISSIGCFVRFTFPMFAWPAVWCAIFNQPSVSNNNSTGNRLFTYAKRLLLWTVGFLASTIAIVSFDTWYFSTQRRTNLGWVIAPFNNFIYNLDEKNLADHVLHDRYLHSVVNMPILYGPLYLLLVWIYARNIRSTVTTIWSFFSNWFVPNTNGKEQVALMTVISGLGLISLAKHQEPRFLLPLTLPLCMLAVANHEKNRINIKKLVSWVIVFSFLLTIFFGVLHQGGVLQSLFYLDNQQGHAIYHHCYMPPSYLLFGNSNMTIHDLGGGDVSEKLAAKIASLSGIQEKIFIVSNAVIGDECITSKSFLHLSTESWTWWLNVCQIK